MLDKNIPDIDALEIRETGLIREVRKGIAYVSGLSACIYGELVELGNRSVKGIVVGFNEDEVLTFILGNEQDVILGEEVRSQSEALEIPVGEDFIGRMVNCLGNECDGKGEIKPAALYPVFRQAPGVMERVPISEPLSTGIRTIDTVIPLGKGQRELIIGDRVTGKTTIALDTMLNQKGKDVICIYCWIGGSFSSLLRIVRTLIDQGVMDYTIIAAAPAYVSPAEQYLIPYTAATLGEYFMRQGKDVLVVFDDLTKHAWIYRQLSLLLERSPGREAYPGDIFYLHSQLMERAGRLNIENGEGTMTFLPIVETQQGDVTGYIPSNLVSMTDGQIYLSTPLFHEGFRPAIDIGLSVSRIGSKVQCEAIRDVSKTLRREYAQYKDLARIMRIKTKVSLEVTDRIKRGEALRELFIQDAHKIVSVEEEIVLFYAFLRNILEILPKESLIKFKKEIFGYLTKERFDLIEKLKSQGRLSTEIKEGLSEIFVQFFKEKGML